MVLKIGIIGCGIIGQKRANIAYLSNFSKVLAVADIDLNKAKLLE